VSWLGRRAAVVAVGVTLICGGFALSATPGPEVQVRPAPAASATPSAAPDVSVESEATGRLEIPGYLSAPLLHMTVPESGILDPPTWFDVYLVENYAAPRDTNSGSTVFLALHSGRGTTDAIGNALIDRTTGTSALEAGAPLVVDGVRFSVTGTRTLEKGTMSEQADLWDGTHDLILVTCSQYSDGRPSQNSVVAARRS
jgi:hypothetical protein